MLEKTTDKWELSQLNVIQKMPINFFILNQLMDYRRAELGVFELKLQYVSPLRVSMETHSLFEKWLNRNLLTTTLLTEQTTKIRS